MQINTDVYPEVGYDSYSRWSNETIDYNASEPLEHSIFYAGTISENVQFCDENNYSYIAQAPNCAFSVTPREIVKGDIFFIKDGYRHFNFNGEWVYNNSYDYNIVTEFDISQFYFDLDKLTVHVYDISQPDGGHNIGAVISMPFSEYRNKSAEYKATHLIRDCLHNWTTGQTDSFLKYKNIADYTNVNVVPMIRYVFNDKTTLYLPFGMLTNYANISWQGPYNLDSFTGFGKFGYQMTDIYLAQYPGIGKWSEGWTPGSAAQAVTMANCGNVDSLIIHAGSAGQQVQQIINGYQMPDLATIDTDKYAVPVFLWGNRWDKRVEAFYTDEFIMRYFASSGLRFKVDDVMYIGYMDANGQCNGSYLLESELADSDSANKDITDFTGSVYDSNIPYVPPTPPSPTPGTWDDMPGAGSSIGALAGARCYVCSKTDITNLKNWMSKTEADGGPPDGYDVLSSLISVMAFPIDMTPASSGPATAISFTGLRTATDNQLVNIAAALLSIANSVGAVPKTEIKTFTSTATALPSAGNPFTIDLGTCDCPTFYSGDFPFVDYDASVELYLPFIGTMSLDTQTVMGNSLHAYMSVDPITGAIYAWCECTKDGSRVVVASGSGAFGVNTPITANQVGMAMAQIKNNAAQTRQTAIQSALTLGVGAFAGMDKNISSILSRNMTQAIGQRSVNIAIATGRDYMDALSVGASQAAMTAIPNAIGANLNSGRANRQIAQANHNSVTGSAGGSTADWSCSYTPYLKVITPDVHRAGEQYEHTYGVPTIQSGTLNDFSGLTFCANPDVSSISTATDQEKQQIFGLLTGGVYV